MMRLLKSKVPPWSRPARGSDALVPAREAYDHWAATYDLDANLTRDLDAKLLRAAPLPLDASTVVELGAGTGKNTVYLATRAARVIALDQSPSMLARAREKVSGDQVQFVQHDITQSWPLQDSSTDLVVGNLVLEHVRDIAAVFREARRVLRTGGTFYICELHPFRQLLGSGARFSSGGRQLHVEAYVHSASEYIATALASGFELRSIAEVSDEAPGPGAVGRIPRLLQLTFAARERA